MDAMGHLNADQLHVRTIPFIANVQSNVTLNAPSSISFYVQMGSLPRLELMRVAVNNLQEVPESFSGLHKLAWFSLAGNPACAEAPPPR